MPKPRKFLCINPCIFNNTRFTFGQPCVANELPSHHFVEVEPHELSLTARDILAGKLMEMDIEVNPDWSDATLQRLYAVELKQSRETSNKSDLVARAKEIGAKYHHAMGIPKLKAVIEDREAELNAEEARREKYGD